MGKDRFQKKITAAIYCKKGLNQCCVRLYRDLTKSAGC